jgi:DNA-binding NarL/FixJ family response regulator
MKIRIAVVDDHAVVRHGLIAALSAEPDLVVVGEARTGENAVRLAREQRPDVMILDVKLEDLDGPEVCRRVVAAAPKTAVVMLSSFRQEAMILRSLAAGAKGYVVKDVELPELKRMIRSVARGQAVLDPKVVPDVIAAAALPASTSPSRTMKHAASLSDIDLAIIRHLANGLSTKEIAAAIHRSPYTIKDHLEKIRASLAVRSRSELIAKAVSAGLV